MSRGLGTRWRVWWSLLVGAAVLAWLGNRSPADAVASAAAAAGTQPPRTAQAASGETADRPASARSPMPQALSIDLPVDRHRLYPPSQAARPNRDLFATVSWLPAPTAAAPPPAPARPADTGPALPTLTVLGKKLEAQQWEVYLAHGDRTLVAREGATIDEALKVERIAPPTMVLTVLSTGQAMTLDVGEAR